MSEPTGVTADGDQRRDVRVGQVLNDFLDRRARGEAANEAELLARHPELADDLRSHLDLLGNLQPDEVTLERLIERSLLERCSDPGYPAKLGVYKVSAVLGRGGMGIVLKARDQDLKRDVALKVLRPELADDAAALARFTREAQAAAALRHPNIVTVHAVGHEGGAHYLAMEYVEGPSLASEIIRRGPLPTEMIRDVFRQLLSALSAAHQAGLIHRDVKSSNILLDGWHGQAKGPQTPELVRGEAHRDTTSAPGGVHDPGTSARTEVRGSESAIRNPQSAIVVKLADFGLARMLSARTRMTLAGSVLGTPEYMSPEQARGDEHIDQRTDLYSAGVVLYEMLTGRTPFRADTPSAVIHRIIHEDPPDPRTITKQANPHLASLALRLMAKQPEDRFESADEAITALHAGERVCLVEKHRRLRRKTLAGVCLLAVLAGGAWALTRFWHRPDTSTIPAEVKPAITRVWVGENQQTRIFAEYGHNVTGQLLHEFPEGAGQVSSVEVLTLQGSEDQIVVAGTYFPVGRDCLFALDTDGTIIWSMDLSDDRRWPDCAPSTEFGCRVLTKADLDGQPGDELVVVANDVDQYPTRISIVDPHAREVRSTFWHMGNIHQVLVAPDLLGPGRPAIIARGVNNKLDGFDDGLREGERRFTSWDVVPVAMILDPAAMDGLGPPRTSRVSGVPPARPWAYALADCPASIHEPDVSAGRDRPRYPEPEQVLAIRGLRLEPCPSGQDTHACIRLALDRIAKAGGGAVLTLNNLLEPRRIIPDERDRQPEAHWISVWHVLMKRGQCVD